MQKIALNSVKSSNIWLLLKNVNQKQGINKIGIVLYLLLSLSNFSYGQLTDGKGDPKVIPVSPNAASLGLYGKIPVSFFNGLPQITIPISKIVTGGEDLNLSVSYHGGGIRPEEHPGWTGLGWNLSAGGSIVRKVYGFTDEYLEPNGNPVTKFSYYKNFGTLKDDNTWFSTPTIESIYGNRSLVALPNPDEFMFNFGGYSGSFYYDHTGHWQVKSDQSLNLKVEEELINNFTVTRQIMLSGTTNLSLEQIFYKFTITTPDGSKYIFGGTPQSIEISRGASSALTRNSYNSNVVASSWALTKIITNNGRETIFTYDRGNALATITSGFLYSSANVSDNSSGNSSGGDSQTLSVVNPVYLRSIETPDQKILFARSESTELRYNYSLITDAQITDMVDYGDLAKRGRNNDLTNNSRWQKLDSISIFSKQSGFLKKVSFSYSASESSRLMLKTIKEYGADGASKPSYVFDYDETVTLPQYSSREIDHWGFYNGVNFLKSLPPYPANPYTKENALAYGNSKSSNLSLMRAGNLIAVSYPTGGKTTFEYEPHEYSKVAKRYPFEIEDTNNLQCGGLRISKISDFDETGKLAEVKEYKYVLNYEKGGTASSGILGGRPNYVEEGKAYYNDKPDGYVTYWMWRDVSAEPLSFTNGNHVTYSEVIEKLKDGSYTIYKYSNHDQPKYRDQPAINWIITSDKQWLLDPNISRALERGKLLEKKAYKTNNIIQQAINYQYDETDLRYYEHVRIIDFNFLMIMGRFNDNRYSAYAVYTFPSFLAKEISTSYDTNGLNPVTTTKGYVYDRKERNLKKEFLLNSRKDSINTYYNYPGNMSGKDPSGVYADMYSKHILSPVIEKITKLNTKQTNYIRNTFFNPYAGIYVSKSIEEQIGSGPLKMKLIYDKYDEKGNILGFYREKGLKVNYLWGYKGLYPVAEIKNVSYAEIENKLTKAAINNLSDSSPDKLTVDNFISPLKAAFPDAQISTFTYKPSIGMVSQTDAKILSAYYNYDSFQRLQLIKNKDLNIVKSFAYNYAEKKYNNKEQRKSLYRNNCTGAGSSVTYVVEAGKYSASTPEEAEKMATDDINNNAQNYANANGECFDSIYARVESSDIIENPNTQATSVLYKIKLYADAACTKPLVLSKPLALSYKTTQTVTRVANPYTQVTDASLSAATGTSEISIGRVIVVDCPAEPISQIDGARNAGALMLPPSGRKPCISRRITLNDGGYIVVPN